MVGSFERYGPRPVGSQLNKQRVDGASTAARSMARRLRLGHADISHWPRQRPDAGIERKNGGTNGMTRSVFEWRIRCGTPAWADSVLWIVVSHSSLKISGYTDPHCTMIFGDFVEFSPNGKWVAAAYFSICAFVWWRVITKRSQKHRGGPAETVAAVAIATSPADHNARGSALRSTC